MPGILVFLEHHGSELQKGSLGVLAKAAQLGGGDVAAVLVGANVKALAAEAGTYGATKVHVAEDASLEPPLPQLRPNAACIRVLMQPSMKLDSTTIFVIPNDAPGENVIPEL